MPFGYVYRKRVARRIRLKRELRHMIDVQRLMHAARILCEFERTKDMHADETRVEREHLKKALKEAQAAHDATSDDEQRLDISKRIVELASRYIAIGGDRYHLHDLPKPKAARKAKA